MAAEDAGRGADLVVRLADAAATEELGALLARTLPEAGRCRAVLFFGELGAGKTTLIRGLVAALPGGAAAEVSSPSFNLCNLYPTEPEVAHFDLYRLEGMCADESLLEALDGDGAFGTGAGRPPLVLVEWAERLAPDCAPEHGLEVHLSPDGAGRRARLCAVGDAALWLAALFRAADRSGGRLDIQSIKD